MALGQLAETGGAAAAGDGGCPAPPLLLPQGGAAGRHPLCTGYTAGQAGDTAPATGHCHLGWAGLLRSGWLHFALLLLVLLVGPGIDRQGLLPSVDNLAALGPDEVLSVGRENAQGVLLARPGLPVDDIRALVHVDGALGQRAGHLVQGVAE